MKHFALLRCVILLGVTLPAALPSGRAAQADDAPPPAVDKPAFTPGQVQFFETEVLPILRANCFKCHGGEARVRGGFRLTSRDGLLKGGELGDAINLKQLEASLLLEAIGYEGDIKMPPTGRLKKEQVETLRKWVTSGLPWSSTADYGVEPESHESSTDAGDYWAWQPIRRLPPPAVQHGDWVRNPIDAFILQKLEARGLAPSKPADRTALIRRASYNLTGLPPAPADVDRLLADTSEKWFERYLDQLLASPQYGEKWGRHWLDLVRYAETHGYERDSAKPEAWRYRDYVIQAFNSDKPYDRFLLEQLAGDELPEVTAETLTATGYYRLGLWDDEPADREQALYDGFDDIIKTTSEVVLGMTMGCARCHDHKGDPILQKDYYSFLAWFRDVVPTGGGNIRHFVTEADRQQHAQAVAAKDDREADMIAELAGIEARLRRGLTERLGLPASQFRRSPLDDLQVRVFRGRWKELPLFDTQRQPKSRPLPEGFLEAETGRAMTGYGFAFDGRLRVPADGRYMFHLAVNDGARLTIADQVLFEQLSHDPVRTEIEATLKAGSLPFRLEFASETGHPELEFAWSGESVPRQSLTATDRPAAFLAADSRRQGQLWKYTLEKPSDDWTQPDYSETSWEEGPGGFGTRGTPGSAVRTEWTTSDIWLRRWFEIETVPDSLSLDLHWDEDTLIYLNGVLVHTTRRFVTDYQRIALDDRARQALRPGRNVIAIHCHHSGGGQYIDAGLLAGDPLDFNSALARHGADLLGAAEVERFRTLTTALENSRKTRLPDPGIPIMAAQESGRQPTFILLRGNPHVPGPEVSPGVPGMLHTTPPQVPATPPTPSGSGKRTALVQWMTSPENPLTARVMANRLWQYHFGRGIVPSANDFGVLGDGASHPELLDWLAVEFRDGGWTLKRMHKLIMLSAAWQQTSQAGQPVFAPAAEFSTVDPDNRLLWRSQMRRLTSEEIRDSILTATGELNLQAGGPGIYVPIPAAVLAGQSVPGKGWGESSPEDAARRSVYIHLKRSLLVPVLEMHDQADTDLSCPVRYVTTVPTQSLGMLNGEFTHEKAAQLAARVRREAGPDPDRQVRLAVRLTTSRQPDAREVESDLRFYQKLKTDDGLSDDTALTMFCLLLLNTNEFIYLD